MDVSVIIINYNTRQMTSECISSIFDKTKDVKFEIILVDNASTDGSKEYFEKDSRITYIYNQENLGFGKANNVGAKYAQGKYLFLLNSDTLLLDNSIKSFFDYMQMYPDVAACGGKLIKANGQEVTSHGVFPSLLEDFSKIGFYKLYKRYYFNNISIAQTSSEGVTDNVDYICGADIFIRKVVFDEFNGFDEDYFMYYEETDLFFRMRKAGYVANLIPSITIVHLEGGSSTKNNICRVVPIKKYRILMQSRILFFRKHKPKYALFLMRVYNIIHHILRYKLYRSDFNERISIIRQ